MLQRIVLGVYNVLEYFCCNIVKGACYVKRRKRLSEYYAGLATELSECRQETRNNETLSIQILAAAGAFMAFVYGAFFSEKT